MGSMDDFRRALDEVTSEIEENRQIGDVLSKLDMIFSMVSQMEARILLLERQLELEHAKNQWKDYTWVDDNSTVTYPKYNSDSSYTISTGASTTTAITADMLAAANISLADIEDNAVTKVVLEP